MSIEHGSVEEQINENGPAPSEELPWTPSHNYQTGGNVKRFDPRGRGFSDGMTTVVYYTDECDPKNVINRWLQMNEEYVEGVSNISIYHRIREHDIAFNEDAKDILGPFEEFKNREGGGTSDMDVCPMCGGEVTSALPYHLPCEEDDE